MSLYNPIKLSVALATATLMFTPLVLAQNGSDYYDQEDMASYNVHKGVYISANVGGEISVPGQGKSSIYRKGGEGQYIGYQFDDHWAAELGAIFFNTTSSDSTFDPFATSSIDSIGYIAVKGILPLNNSYTLFLKLGWGLERRFDNIEDETSYKGGLFIGPGVEFSLAKNLGLTLEYNAVIAHQTTIDENDKKDTSYGIAGLLGLGLIYHFTA